MFNKYFQFVTELFESVFKGGEAVSFTDYLYVIGFTLALIVVGVVGLAVLFFVIYGPILVYRKLTKKFNDELSALDCEFVGAKDKEETNKVCMKYEEIAKKLTKRRIGFAIGIIFLYVPIVIPTVLFVISIVQSWF